MGEDFTIEGTAFLRLRSSRSRDRGCHTRANWLKSSLVLSDTKLTLRSSGEVAYPLKASVIKRDGEIIVVTTRRRRSCRLYFEEPHLATIFHDALRRRVLRLLRDGFGTHDSSPFTYSKEEAQSSLLGAVFTSDAFNQVLASEQLSADCMINLEGVSKSFFRIFAHNPVRWKNVEISTLRQAAMIAAYHGEFIRKCIITSDRGPFHKSYLRDLAHYCPHLEEVHITLSAGEMFESLLPWIPLTLKRLTIYGGRLRANHMVSSVVDKLPKALRSLYVTAHGFMDVLLTTGTHSSRPDLIFTAIINCFGADSLPAYPVQATLRVIIGCIYSLWQANPDLTHLAVWSLSAVLSSSCFSDPPVESLVEANDLILRALEENSDVNVLRLGTYSIFLVFRRSLLQQPKGKAVVEAAVRRSHVIEILSNLVQSSDVVVLRNSICILDLVSYAGIGAWISHQHVPLVAEAADAILSKFPSYHGDLTRPSMEHLHAHQILQRLRQFFPSHMSQSQPAAHLEEKQKTLWLKSLQPFDVIDAMDTEQAAWYESFVVQTDNRRGIQVHFLGWNPSWRRWIPYDEPYRVQKRNAIVPLWRPQLRCGDKIDVKLPLAQIAHRKHATVCKSTIVIPKNTEMCSLEEEGDANARPRWKAGCIGAIDGDLMAKVTLTGIAVVPAQFMDISTFTFGQLLDFGFDLEFWVDLNGNGVMPFGTHTQKLSTKRPVWGFLPAPKLPCGDDVCWDV